jgi:PPOX class probable F420-dependent enzyme
VCLLVDHYADDWAQLRWARADGTARILEPAQAVPALDQLRRRYPQYSQIPLTGPVIAVTVHRWSGWSASATSSGTA